MFIDIQINSDSYFLNKYQCFMHHAHIAYTFQCFTHSSY